MSTFDAMEIKTLKLWAAHHKRRKLESDWNSKEFHFHVRAARDVELRISAMRRAKRHKIPVAFDWEAFCDAYSPRGTPADI